MTLPQPRSDPAQKRRRAASLALFSAIGWRRDGEAEALLNEWGERLLSDTVGGKSHWEHAAQRGGPRAVEMLGEALQGRWSRDPDQAVADLGRAATTAHRMQKKDVFSALARVALSRLSADAFKRLCAREESQFWLQACASADDATAALLLKKGATPQQREKMWPQFASQSVAMLAARGEPAHELMRFLTPMAILSPNAQELFDQWLSVDGVFKEDNAVRLNAKATREALRWASEQTLDNAIESGHSCRELARACEEEKARRESLALAQETRAAQTASDRPRFQKKRRQSPRI